MTPQTQLDRIARRERQRRWLLILGLLAALAAFTTMSVRFSQNPLRISYIPAEVVHVTDVSSGTGVAFEIVVRFNGLQKMFTVEDLDSATGPDGMACILQTRGRSDPDVPTPRYYALTASRNCN